MRVADCPAHRVVEVADTVTVGKGSTVTVVEICEEQPLVVPVAVYTVVTEGVAITELAVVLLRLEPGDQE